MEPGHVTLYQNRASHNENMFLDYESILGFNQTVRCNQMP